MLGLCRGGLPLLLFISACLCGFAWFSNVPPNTCDLPSMNPVFSEVSVAGSGRYHLYHYRDSRCPKTLSDSVRRVILFVPGQRGSYKEIRSIGSVFLLSAPHRCTTAAVYSLDFQEEFSAIHPTVLLDELEFSERSLNVIESLHPHAEIILLGHSMGGILSRLLHLSSLDRRSIAAILTLHTPHAYPMVASAEAVSIYADLHAAWKASSRVPLFVLGGGRRDRLVSAETMQLESWNLMKSHWLPLQALPYGWEQTDHHRSMSCLHSIWTIASAAHSCFDLTTNVTHPLDVSDGSKQIQATEAMLSTFLRPPSRYNRTQEANVSDICGEPATHLNHSSFDDIVHCRAAESCTVVSWVIDDESIRLAHLNAVLCLFAPEERLELEIVKLIAGESNVTRECHTVGLSAVTRAVPDLARHDSRSRTPASSKTTVLRPPPRSQMHVLSAPLWPLVSEVVASHSKSDSNAEWDETERASFEVRLRVSNGVGFTQESNVHFLAQLFARRKDDVASSAKFDNCVLKPIRHQGAVATGTWTWHLSLSGLNVEWITDLSRLSHTPTRSAPNCCELSVSDPVSCTNSWVSGESNTRAEYSSSDHLHAPEPSVCQGSSAGWGTLFTRIAPLSPLPLPLVCQPTLHLVTTDETAEVTAGEPDSAAEDLLRSGDPWAWRAQLVAVDDVFAEQVFSYSPRPRTHHSALNSPFSLVPIVVHSEGPYGETLSPSTEPGFPLSMSTVTLPYQKDGSMEASRNGSRKLMATDEDTPGFVLVWDPSQAVLRGATTARLRLRVSILETIGTVAHTHIHLVPFLLAVCAVVLDRTRYTPGNPLPSRMFSSAAATTMLLGLVVAAGSWLSSLIPLFDTLQLSNSLAVFSPSLQRYIRNDMLRRVPSLSAAFEALQSSTAPSPVLPALVACPALTLPLTLLLLGILGTIVMVTADVVVLLRRWFACGQNLLSENAQEGAKASTRRDAGDPLSVMKESQIESKEIDAGSRTFKISEQNEEVVSTMVGPFSAKESASGPGTAIGVCTDASAGSLVESEESDDVRIGEKPQDNRRRSHHGIRRAAESPASMGVVHSSIPWGVWAGALVLAATNPSMTVVLSWILFLFVQVRCILSWSSSSSQASDREPAFASLFRRSTTLLLFSIGAAGPNVVGYLADLVVQADLLATFSQCALPRVISLLVWPVDTVATEGGVLNTALNVPADCWVGMSWWFPLRTVAFAAPAFAIMGPSLLFVVSWQLSKYSATILGNGGKSIEDDWTAFSDFVNDDAGRMWLCTILLFAAAPHWITMALGIFLVRIVFSASFRPVLTILLCVELVLFLTL
eukprot:Rmarinus@m.25956